MDDQPIGVADRPHDIIYPREQPRSSPLGDLAVMQVPNVVQDQGGLLGWRVLLPRVRLLDAVAEIILDEMPRTDVQNKRRRLFHSQAPTQCDG